MGYCAFPPIDFSIVTLKTRSSRCQLARPIGLSAHTLTTRRTLNTSGVLQPVACPLGSMNSKIRGTVTPEYKLLFPRVRHDESNNKTLVQLSCLHKVRHSS